MVVADDSFPRKSYLIKPYPHRHQTIQFLIKNFNYQLSRARQVAEIAFGILTSNFQFFLTTINTSTDNAEKVVIASCTLHSYL